jgi:hypothetical protein
LSGEKLEELTLPELKKIEADVDIPF